MESFGGKDLEQQSASQVQCSIAARFTDELDWSLPVKSSMAQVLLIDSHMDLGTDWVPSEGVSYYPAYFAVLASQEVQLLS